MLEQLIDAVHVVHLANLPSKVVVEERLTVFQLLVLAHREEKAAHVLDVAGQQPANLLVAELVVGQQQLLLVEKFVNEAVFPLPGLVCPDEFEGLCRLLL